MADGTCARRFELQKRLQDSQKSAAVTFANLNKELRRISECLDRLEGQPARINGESADRRAPPPRFLPVVNKLLEDGGTPPEAPAIQDLSGAPNSSGALNTTGSGSGSCSSQITRGRYSPWSLLSTPPAGKNGIDCISRNEEVYPFNFDGSGNVLEWISQCEQYFYFDKTSAYNRTIAASMFMEGNALRWYESYKKSTVNWSCWLEFCAQLSHRFEVVPDDRARVEHIEVHVNEVQEVADLNSENRDVVEVPGDVFDQDFSILQSHSSGSLNGESDEIDVVDVSSEVSDKDSSISQHYSGSFLKEEKEEIVCNVDDKEPHLEELEACDFKEDRQCDYRAEFLREFPSIGSLEMAAFGSKCRDGVSAVKIGNAQMREIMKNSFWVHGYMHEVLTELMVKEAFFFGLVVLKMLVEYMEVIKDEKCWDFKRYKKKMEQSQDVLLQAFKVLHFFLFARFKGRAGRFWLRVDGILFVGSFKMVHLLVLAVCNSLIVAGAGHYPRGFLAAILQSEVSERKRNEKEPTVGVKNHNDVHTFLPKTKLEAGEAFVSILEALVQEEGTCVSELILDRQLRNVGNIGRVFWLVKWKNYRADYDRFSRQIFRYPSLRSRMFYRGGVVNTSHFEEVISMLTWQSN